MLERIAHGPAPYRDKEGALLPVLTKVQLHRRGDAAFRFLSFLFMEMVLSSTLGLIVCYKHFAIGNWAGV
jgi:hypothetical protein